MPSIQNPISLAESTEFRNAVKGALIVYAGKILRTETAVVAPAPGYKVYDKRMAFAAKALHNVDLYAFQAATLVASMSSTFELDDRDEFRFMWQDNSISRNIFESRGETTDESAGDTYGQVLTIFDALAGVNLGDFQ